MSNLLETRRFIDATPEELDALPVGSRFVDLSDMVQGREWRNDWTLTKDANGWGRPARRYKDAADMIEQWPNPETWLYTLFLPGERVERAS